MRHAAVLLLFLRAHTPRCHPPHAATLPTSTLQVITDAQHHHVAAGGPNAGPLKPSAVPLMLGFPLFEAL